MASHDTRAELAIPTSRGRAPPANGSAKASFSSTKPAMVMAGMPSRNEKRAASERFQPSSRAAVRVLPERDTPGTRARAWAKPTSQPSRTRTASSPRRRAPSCSAKPNSSAITIDTTPIEVRLRRGERSKSGTNSLMPRPATRIGKVPSRMANPRRASGSCQRRWRRAAPMARATCCRSRRKKPITAAMLPSWITAVTDTPGSPHPSNTGTTFRWAVLLMGRNSVRPCTTPSTP